MSDLIDACTAGDITCVIKWLDQYTGSIKDELIVDALYTAISTSKTDIVALLVNRGADVNAIHEHGYPPLYNAIHSKPPNYVMIKFLLDAGANVHFKNINGDTILHSCICAGDWKEITLLLLAAGVDVNTQNNYGSTPILHISIYDECWDEKILFLLSVGANINTANSNGNTVLHCIVRLGSYYAAFENKTILERIRFLLDHGASPEIQNKDGVTALDIAKTTNNGDNEMVVLIQSSLASRGIKNAARRK